MANVRYKARIVVIDVILSLNLAAIFNPLRYKGAVPLTLASSTCQREKV
jgi:hypothetical protein